MSFWKRLSSNEFVHHHNPFTFNLWIDEDGLLHIVSHFGDKTYTGITTGNPKDYCIDFMKKRLAELTKEIEVL